MIVVSVEKNSPASKAGMVVGDIVVAMNGRAVKDTRDVQNFLTGEYIGKAVQTAIIRGGQRMELSTLTIGEK